MGKELTLKMNALKGMYQMDRRNCVALNAAIDLTVNEVKKRVSKIGDSVKVLSESVQGLTEDVMRQIQNSPSSPSKTSDAAPDVEEHDNEPSNSLDSIIADLSRRAKKLPGLWPVH